MFALIKSSGMDWFNMNFEHVCRTQNEWEKIDKLAKVNLLIQKTSPKVVLGLGQEILNILEPNSDLSKYRGSVFEKDNYTFIPTYHHTEVSKQSWKKSGSGTAKMASVFMSDFQKAVNIAEHGKEELKEIFNLDPSPKEVVSFIEKAIDEQILLAGDIEGTGLSREHSIMVVLGLATDKEHAIVIPFKKLNGVENYSFRDQIIVENAVQRLFKYTRGIIWQNGYRYDIPVITNDRNGYYYPFTANGGDTLLMQHALSPEMPLNIGFLSSIWTQSKYWKEGFLTRKEHIYKTDQMAMRLYNARDCVEIHKIREPLEAELHKQNLWETYLRELSYTEFTMEMTRNGIPISQNRLIRWNRLLNKRLITAVEQVKEPFNWGDEIKLSSNDDMRFVLYGVPPAKSLKAQEALTGYQPWTSEKVYCDECGKESWLSYKNHLLLTDHIMLKCSKCKETQMHLPNGETKPGKLKSKDTKVYKQLQQDIKLLFIKRPYQMKQFKPRRTESGDLGTDSKVRVSYLSKINQRLEELSKLKRRNKDHEIEEQNFKDLTTFLTKYNHWASEHKLKSTYSSFPIWEDGRIHPSFAVHGTATGRLAGSEPNPQNFPTLKKEPELRKLFTAPPGYLWLSVDYEGLENFVLAYTAQDQVLIDLLWTKLPDSSYLNLHDVNTETLYGIKKGHKMWVKLRDTAKIFQFSHIAYGGSLIETHRNMLEKVPDCGITLAALKKGKEAYVERFKQVGDWQEEVKRIARDERYTENAFGFRRTLYGNDRDIEKQALNTPIQGGAAHVINEASKRIAKRLHDSKLIRKSKFNLQVHDENIFLVYVGNGKMFPGELPDVYKIVMEEMTKPVDFYGIPRKFRVDAEIGPSLGELYAFDPVTFKRLDGNEGESKHG
jgi:DNA polymerase I-like protein with 3'-5' exonuclease and polymerase domains